MTEKLKGKATLKAYHVWKACIYSGVYVRITILEGQSVAMGFCSKKDRYVDFEVECEGCKKFKMIRTPPKHERTALRKVRIGTARKRSIAKRKELFNTDKWRTPGTKKR